MVIQRAGNVKKGSIMSKIWNAFKDLGERAVSGAYRIERIVFKNTGLKVFFEEMCHDSNVFMDELEHECRSLHWEHEDIDDFIKEKFDKFQNHIRVGLQDIKNSGGKIFRKSKNHIMKKIKCI